MIKTSAQEAYQKYLEEEEKAKPKRRGGIHAAYSYPLVGGLGLLGPLPAAVGSAVAAPEGRGWAQFGGTLGGGLGGALLGRIASIPLSRSFGMPGAVVPAVLGSVGGSLLGHHLTSGD